MDTVTYPQPAVAEFIGAHFVPVKLNLSDDAEAAQARELVPLWTPTFIITDGRGREVHREIGYLPPQDFLPMLRLAHAKALLATAQAAEAIRVLDAALEQHTQSEYVPQLLYWRGIVGYQAQHDRAQLAEYWGRLQREFPQSTWATRCSFFKPS